MIALIIIDVNNYFASKTSSKYLSTSKKTVPNIIKLHQHFNKKNFLTVLTRHGHTGNGDLGMMGKFYKSFIHIDESESDLITNLPIINDNVIICKKTYDAFWETNLDDILKNKQIQKLVITGCLTHLCCETTTRSAFVRGYQPIFVSDATFTYNNKFQKATLLNLENGFAKIITTKELIKNV